MNLIIDTGNTRTKLAIFQDFKITSIDICEHSKIFSEIEKKIKKFPVDKAIMSSVAHLDEQNIRKIQELVPTLILNNTTDVPFDNLYKTKDTLGVDRIALVANACKKFPNKNVLIIDAGTCITFDLKNSKNEYLGGAISPGIRMRFKALHHFTSKLPLIETTPIDYLIGNTTTSSISSGVINGIVTEIDGIIQKYNDIYTNLTVVLTGGDTNFLANQLKSSIFANNYFLLEGLNEILTHNQNK